MLVAYAGVCVWMTQQLMCLLLDLVMVAMQGMLIGLTVRMSVGTLRIGACGCMECVICLLSSVWGMGILAGACTLGTRCMMQI
jgi:hypothetical protein